ncbi:MAG: hypothetical protein WCJ66_15400 [Verrucomicrobiota bacterium]
MLLAPRKNKTTQIYTPRSFTIRIPSLAWIVRIPDIHGAATFRWSDRTSGTSQWTDPQAHH